MRNIAKDRAAIEYHRRVWGIEFPGAEGFIEPEWKRNFGMALDAQPSLVTQANAGIPSMLVTFIDPDIYKVLTAKNQAAEIFGEVRKGSFIDVTAIFPVVEHTGEVSSYGDFNENGRTGLNTNFPNRESYLYQTVCEWGDLELERAGEAKIQWANEVKQSGVIVLNKFQNLTYFLGVSGLQNYGLLNDPSLPTAIAPSPKANGGLTWLTTAGAANATAAEVYNDLLALVTQLFIQSAGLVDAKSKMTLAMSPKSSAALNLTNTYNVNVTDQLKKNYPNLEVKSAVQYGALTAQNSQGSALGEIVQLIADDVEGQQTGYCAFNEKLRGGPVIRAMSSVKQKMAQGTWGAVVRQPFAIAQMIGV